MATYPTNGHWEEDPDWQASLDYSNDLERHPWPARDLRTPCQNPLCDTLTEALFCSETCREAAEGPDHEIDTEEPPHTPSRSVAPLPEAPASINVRLMLHGRECQLTLRDSDEGRLLERLAVVLARVPVEPSTQASAAPTQAPAGKDWCKIHKTSMKEQHGKDGSKWHSHRLEGGTWCKGR
jgi:hypothetical protein